MKVMPSIDISGGKAVKRVKGKPGSGIEIGDPLEVAKRISREGYDSIHVVDLDGAEGKGRNLSLVKDLSRIGFSWIQVGGGVRDLHSASSLVDAGVSAVVMSTLPFTNEPEFLRIVDGVGKDKVMVSLDYNSEGKILIRGWSHKLDLGVAEAVERVNQWGLRGVIFTYVENEGTKGGIDHGIGERVSLAKGIKEYAGGISTMDDLKTLREARVDYAIVGMAFYTNSIRGVIDV